jgi:chemotaxis protein methyltransferase CheR
MPAIAASAAQDATVGGTREFAFTDADFERVRRLIRAYAGISLSPAKREMAYGRLVRRLRVLGLASFGAYLDRVEADALAEREAFVNALTTNLTAFFREPHHFPVLAEHLRAIRGRTATVWCCAASTGEEPYSIAITAVETFASVAPPVRILASDVDTGALRIAEAGIYALEQLDKLDAVRRKRFFLRGTGTYSGKARVRDELRDLVVFRRINLLEPDWPLRGPLDAIFCRNVMIYFDKETQRTILERFVPLLRPDGLLFVGHSESLHHAAHLFRPCGRTVYRLARSGGA